MTQTRMRFTAEVRARAVRMVLEYREDYGSEWAAITSIASKVGCGAETLRKWVRRSEPDRDVQSPPIGDTADRLKVLERENRELRQANEILRKASAYFAQAELDRPWKR